MDRTLKRLMKPDEYEKVSFSILESTILLTEYHSKENIVPISLIKIMNGISDSIIRKILTLADFKRSRSLLSTNQG